MVDRKGEPEALMVAEPFVSLTGAIQPEVLQDLSKGPEDGMLDRFVLSFPDPVTPGWRDAEITEAAERRYAEFYKQLRGRHLGRDEFGEPLPQRLVFASDAKAVLIEAVDMHAEETARPGFPSSLAGVYGKLEAYIGRLSLLLAMARSIEENAAERIEAVDVVAAMALIGYFKRMARRVYKVIRDANRLDGLAEDLALLLQGQGGHWRGEPSELYSQLPSQHKPERVNEFGRMLRAAVKRQPRLTLEDHHERVVKEYGTVSTRRLIRLDLLSGS